MAEPHLTGKTIEMVIWLQPLIGVITWVLSGKQRSLTTDRARSAGYSRKAPVTWELTRTQLGYSEENY
jgi:hypothetical protein